MILRPSSSKIQRILRQNLLDDDKLPTPEKLSEELCNIISERYSRNEALCTLDRLYKWAFTKDSDFLKSFHVCGEVLSVLTFLKKTMNDGNCVGAARMECVESAFLIFANITYTGESNVNMEIATNMAITLMECDGINTLINSSEEYAGGDNTAPHLKILCIVWGLLLNITAKTDVMKDGLNKDQVIAIFDTGIDTISQVKSVVGPFASVSCTLELIFGSLYNIVADNYVTKKYFQDKDVLSKCLEVFKKDNTWKCRGETVMNRMNSAIQFFTACHYIDLLDKSSDYEILFPLLVMVLKEFPSNDDIRKRALYVIDDAYSIVNDKKTIVRSGAIEVLGALLVLEDINEAERNFACALIHKITAS
ncbi:MAG: hypothetical protein ACI90V_009637 [Bacillariaceae sp.]|jgi:hypothetical protein